MITTSNHIKITDFGVSFSTAQSGTSTRNVGEVGYKAPEMMNDNQYAYSIDIWNLGIIAYQMVKINKRNWKFFCFLALFCLFILCVYIHLFIFFLIYFCIFSYLVVIHFFVMVCSLKMVIKMH
jgi:serine/threonine protein kinase